MLGFLRVTNFENLPISGGAKITISGISKIEEKSATIRHSSTKQGGRPKLRGLSRFGKAGFFERQNS